MAAGWCFCPTRPSRIDLGCELALSRNVALCRIAGIAAIVIWRNRALEPPAWRLKIIELRHLAGGVVRRRPGHGRGARYYVLFAAGSMVNEQSHACL